MGKYIRHLIGGLVGGLVGALVSWMGTQGTVVDPGAVSTVTEFITTAISLGVTFVGYAWTEKFLKRFKGVDTEGFIDHEWLKREARHPTVPR